MDKQPTRKIIAMGETVLDILFRNGQPVAAVPGGSSFNSIISVGRSGVPCMFVGYTGGDIVGRNTQQFLTDNGVNASCFEMRPDEKSAISLAYLNSNGDADYVFYKQPPMARPGAPLPLFQTDDLMLFGSYYAICQGMRSQVEEMLKRANEAKATIYYDLNFRRSHREELDTLIPAIHDNFSKSTIVRGSADDFEIMYGTRSATEIYEHHIRTHCPLFICTAGADDITICTPKHTFEFNAPHIDNVVSTVGAGDNFNAGFLCGMVRYGIHRDDLPTMSQIQWQQLVDTACAYAGQVCQNTDNYISPAWGKTQQLPR